MNNSFLYIIFFSLSLSKLIKTSYTITDGKMWTSIALGVPTINLHKPISLNSHYSIITDRSYNKTKSKTSSHKTYKMIYYGSKEINAEVICEVAPSAANNFSVLKYCFYYIIDSDLIFNSIEKFGFAFSPYDKELSLIHQLKKNNEIEHLAFSFVPYDDNEGALYFGGINSIKDQYQFNCSVVDAVTSWSCAMNYVFIEGKKINVYSNIFFSLFDTNEQFILAPDDFMRFFLSLLKEEGANCDYISGDFSGFFDCDENAIHIMKSISFQFDTRIEFPIKEMFYCTFKRCKSYIKYNINSHTKWIFGTVFLKRFNSLFDYEDKRVTLYSSLDVFKSPYKVNDNGEIIQSKLNYIKYFYIMISIISTMMTVMLLTQKCFIYYK